MKANLKVVSDGTAQGTHIYADDRELIGATHLWFSVGVENRGGACVTFSGVALELDADVELEASFDADDVPLGESPSAPTAEEVVTKAARS